jgi:hypothetical protein
LGVEKYAALDSDSVVEGKRMTYLEKQMFDLRHEFPDVPIEALKAGMIAGIEAFAWYKNGVQYVGTTGTKRKDAVKEVLDFSGEAK